MNNTLHAVIMAGGRGARFWPRSREKMPKHLLDIISEETILRETLNRISPIISPDNVLIVTGLNHAEEVRKQAPEIPPENIIIEPMGKNTAPCIGLAALHIKKKSADGLMMVLPADHFIADEKEFRRILAIAGEAARRDEYIITVGIKPTWPATGYGYLELGEKEFTIKNEDVHHVLSVHEKPGATEAENLLRHGGFFWNSGIFVGKVSTFLKAIARWLPDLYSALASAEAALRTKREGAALKRVYASVTPVSFDYGVLEKAGNILLVKGDFGWSDVGSWDALWDILPKDEMGNAVAGDSIFLGRDARNCLIHSPRKLVALAGVKDLIVVDTKDALLICKRGASEEVRHIVDLLEEKKFKDYL